MTLTQIKPLGLSKPVDLADNEKIRLGTGNDLELYHDSNNSIISNSTGELLIDGDTLSLRAGSAAELYLHAVKDGAVNLYHNNSKKFETTSGGTTVTGNVYVTGHFRGDDNSKLDLGNSNDLQIYHDGNHSRILDNGTGKLQIGSDTEVEILNGSFNESIAKFKPNGAVELYHNNSKKLETQSYGCSVTGQIYVTHSGTTPGFSLSDNGRSGWGSGNDLVIYHDGTNSLIDNNTGNLYINSAGDVYLAPNNNEAGVYVRANGSAELYYDNSKKFETVSYGAAVSGILTSTGDIKTMNDTAKFVSGASDDLQMYHDGSNSIIEDVGTGQLRLCGNNAVVLRKSPTGDVYALGNADGSFELFYDNVKKFETNSDGVRATGRVEAFPSSTNSVVAGQFYNNSTGANADCVVIVKTYANQGADPYIKFDAGGSDMIVGNKYGGTTNNKLVLGAGTTISGGVAGLQIDGGGHITPDTNNARELGSTSLRFKNIYTNDLNLSNEGSSNDVDQTWGNWTIQEGESDLFLKNNRSGKKYKFNLTEVS